MAGILDKPSNLADEPSKSQVSGGDISDRVRSLSFAKTIFREGGTSEVNWRRRIVLAICGGTVLVVLGIRTLAGAFFSSRPLELDVLTVQSELSEAIVLDTSGYLMAKTKVQVLPKIPGTIVELNIDEGTKVKKGDLLARLDGAEYAADLAAAKASLAQAKARSDEIQAGSRPEEIQQAESLLHEAEARANFARQDFDRAKQLIGTISQQEFDRSKFNLEEAEAAVEHQEHALAILKEGARPEQIAAAKADVAQAEANLDKAQFWYDSTRITTPLTGTILQKNAELGERLNPEVIGTGLCVVADLSQMEVEVDVQERELTNIAVGQPCRIEPEAYPGQFYEGRVARIMPIANRQRGVVQIRVEVLNDDDRLLPEMNCRVVILSEESSFTPDENLHIPEDAIFGEPDAPFLFVLDGHVARKRPVKTRKEPDGSIVIEEGLFPGERVVVPGGSSLHDGQSVRDRSEDDAG